MRPGDLVEFKAGSHGINAPDNLGLYLDRVKRKGDFFVVLFTTKGKKEFRRDRVGRVRLVSRLPPEVLADEEALLARLRQLAKEAQSESAEESRRVAEAGKDRDLWRRIQNPGVPQSPTELAAAFFDTQSPKPHQVDAVREILKSCDRSGVGYFERVPGPRETWRPISRDEHRRIHQEREALNALRNRLVRSEEVEEAGRVRNVYVGVPIDEMPLSSEDRSRLEFIRDAMADFVLFDRFTGTLGVAGTPVHTIDGWKLSDYLKFLAVDWTGSRATLSSAFVEFLLGVRLWTAQDALQTIARRHVLASAGFEWQMDERAAQEANRVPGEFPPAWLEGRADLRTQECFTIDPADAKDHDDAVGVERLPEGAWRLWVHIADVAHYVQPGSTLDTMAKDRATSLYLPTGVLPMLPPRLSEDLCSLKADVDRLALTVAIDYSAAGDIVREEFREAVIRVRGNVAYPEVDEALEKGTEPFALMGRLASLIQARRRGLELETGEVRVVLSPEAVTSHVKFGTPATKMIEAFMVAANEAVARKLAGANVPALFRCHSLPDRIAVERFNVQMRTMEQPVSIVLPEPKEEGKPAEGPSVLDLLKEGRSLTLVGGGFRIEGEEPAEEEDEAPLPPRKGLAQLSEADQEAWLRPFRAALASVKANATSEVRDIVYLKLLGAMGRAYYTTDNAGHFGLGSPCYCHFTSPIRRYPDLLVHRQLRSLLRGEAPRHTRDDLVEFAAHCSEQGALADDLERLVVQVALLFLERASGRPWPRPGHVNGFARSGAFVSLGDGLEARIFLNDIPGGPWSIDEHDSYLFAGSLDRADVAAEVTAANWRELYDEAHGEMRRVRLRLGDRVGVVRTGFDYVEGKVAAKLAE